MMAESPAKEPEPVNAEQTPADRPGNGRNHCRTRSCVPGRGADAHSALLLGYWSRSLRDSGPGRHPGAVVGGLGASGGRRIPAARVRGKPRNRPGKPRPGASRPAGAALMIPGPQTAALRLGIDLGGSKIAGVALGAGGGAAAEHRVPAPRHDYAATIGAL